MWNFMALDLPGGRLNAPERASNLCLVHRELCDGRKQQARQDVWRRIDRRDVATGVALGNRDKGPPKGLGYGPPKGLVSWERCRERDRQRSADQERAALEPPFFVPGNCPGALRVRGLRRADGKQKRARGPFFVVRRAVSAAAAGACPACRSSCPRRPGRPCAWSGSATLPPARR